MRGERIDLRVTREEKLAWFQAAEACGMILSDWIRSNCNEVLEMDTTWMIAEKLKAKLCPPKK